MNVWVGLDGSAAGHTHIYLCMLRLMAYDWDDFYGSPLLPSSPKNPFIQCVENFKDLWRFYARSSDAPYMKIWKLFPSYFLFLCNKIMMISLSIWKSLSLSLSLVLVHVIVIAYIQNSQKIHNKLSKQIWWRKWMGNECVLKRLSSADGKICVT